MRGIIQSNYNLKKIDKINNLNLMTDKEEVLYVKTNIDGSEQYIFTVEAVRLFDTIVLNNDKKLLSEEQNKFMTDYLEEIVNPKTLSLDEYLAGFYGIEPESTEKYDYEFQDSEVIHVNT